MSADPELHDLVRRAQAGDRVALDAALRRLYQLVRKHVFFTIGSGPVADDAVQEAMIAIHRGLARFRGDSHPRTWALTIATRAAYRVRRRDARASADPELDVAVFDTDQTGAAEVVMLRRALDRLAPKKREAFVLMAIFELTAEEAGHALGTFANTAASRFRHARAELEEHLRRRAADDGKV